MKLFVAALSITAVHSFTFIPSRPSAALTQLDAVKIFYGTSTGNTETCAGYIAENIDGAEAEYIDDAKDEDFTGADALIVGAPTWHTGSDEQRSGTPWDDWLYDTLPSLDLKGKKVAIFGCGDQESYNDYYCDAAGELYDKFVEAGCEVYGFTSTDDYNHSESKAERDGKFIGLMFDEDNQDDMSEGRAKNWISQLNEESFM